MLMMYIQLLSVTPQLAEIASSEGGTVWSNLGISWSTFLEAFLGFGSALLVEAITDSISSRKKRKQVIKHLIQELEKNRDCILSLKDEMVYPSPYSIPVWRGICHSGSVLNLDELKDYADILSIFGSIEESNTIEGKCFDLVMASMPNPKKDEITKTLKQNRCDTMREIERGITILRKAR